MKMCGILAQIINNLVSDRKTVSEKDVNCIRSRGPDCMKTIQVDLGKVRASFTSSVLHLRGIQMAEQPMQSDRFVFQWNGEVFDGLDVALYNVY